MQEESRQNPKLQKLREKHMKELDESIEKIGEILTLHEIYSQGDGEDESNDSLTDNKQPPAV